jgi:hypothetical protein
MSKMEYLRGRVKKIEGHPNEIAWDLLKNKYQQDMGKIASDAEKYDYSMFMMLEDFTDNGHYFEVNGEVYENVDLNRYEFEGEWARAERNLDGTILLDLSFYNGGTCRSEMAEKAILEMLMLESKAKKGN